MQLLTARHFAKQKSILWSTLIDLLFLSHKKLLSQSLMALSNRIYINGLWIPAAYLSTQNRVLSSAYTQQQQRIFPSKQKLRIKLRKIGLNTCASKQASCSTELGGDPWFHQLPQLNPCVNTDFPTDHNTIFQPQNPLIGKIYGAVWRHRSMDFSRPWNCERFGRVPYIYLRSSLTLVCVSASKKVAQAAWFTKRFG